VIGAAVSGDLLLPPQSKPPPLIYTLAVVQMQLRVIFIFESKRNNYEGN
jgi:hypothetical protein